MSVLSLLVNVLGPVVAIGGLGALSGPKLGIEIQSMSRLAYWVLGPAFVFDVFATSQLPGSVAFRLVAAGLTSIAAAALVMLGANTVLASSRSAKAADLMTSVYGNVGNTGLAVAIFALGDDILAAAGVLMLTINLTGMVVGISLAASQSIGTIAAVRRALLAPMPLAAAAAIAVNVAGLDVPTLLGRSIGLVAGALIPVMLYTLGMQLSHTGSWRPSPSLGANALAKLVAAPLAGVAAAWALGLRDENLAVVAIQSAMPPAVFCLIVAREHDLEPERVTGNVVALTLLSLLTLPVILVLVIP